MDFQQARETGYYFDRCIDLVFYNSEKEPIAYLTTPKRGFKPTVTIKGTFIEGGYAIDSYISIQNMAFEVDIAYISYIKARMYYSGLNEVTAATTVNQNLKQGITIMYSVLYADQEKEPPNRCVRFQCVVASKEIVYFNTPLIVNGGTLLSADDSNGQPEVQQNKSNIKSTLKKVCTELINIYNNSIEKNINNGDKKEWYSLLKIVLLEIDEPLEEMEVELPLGKFTLGDFIRQLNSISVESDDTGGLQSAFKIVIDRGVMSVSTPIPSNWTQIAKSEGYSKEQYGEYYDNKYGKIVTKTYSVINGAVTEKDKEVSVPLSFVKSATRSECLIFVETLFDGRITPGCNVTIRSNAIMGKKFGSSKGKNGGSRILHYPGKVTFRNTGKIDYLFSTVEDSYMKLQGPTVDSVLDATRAELARSQRSEILNN